MNELDLTTFKAHLNAMVKKNQDYYNSLDYLWQSNYRTKTDYSMENIENIVDHGTIEEQRAISVYFFKKDGIYKKILYYYATLLTYSNLVIPNPTNGKRLSKDVSKRYYSVLDFVDEFHSEEKWTDMALKVLVEGACYGAISEIDKKQIAIIDLPTEYCRSRYKDIYGNDIVEFNIGYFDNLGLSTDVQEVLKAYPPIFRKYYNRYKNGQENNIWLRLPTDIGFMFSFSSTYCAPLLLAIIPASMRYDDAVDTERERELEEIRKILVQKIPHLNTGELVFEPDEAEVMHEGAVGMLSGNKNISVLTTYADVDAITSKTTSDNVTNTLEKMIQNIYSEAGVSGQIFSATGTQAISTSITNDLSTMMILAHKFSRFFTDIINSLYAQSNLKFTYVILPITYYNRSDFITDAFKLASSGYSYLLPGVALGISQRQLLNIKDLENNVLNLEQVFVPLSSSYTQSANSNPIGAPKKDLEEKAPKTIQNEDSLDKQGGSE